MRLIYILSSLILSKPLYAQTASTGALSQAELGRIVLGLVVVLLIILALAWVLKRLHGFQPAAQGFKTLASYSLGPRERLVLVQAMNRYLLLGITSGSINTLHDFGDSLPSDLDLGESQGFASLLKSYIGKK